MSNDWLDKLASRDAIRDKKKDLQLHKAAVVREWLPVFWEAFVTELQERADAYRKRFPSNQIEGPWTHASVVTIKKATPPAVLIELSCGETTITFSRTEAGKPSTSNISINVDEQNGVSLRLGPNGFPTAADWATYFLGQVVEPFHK